FTGTISAGEIRGTLVHTTKDGPNPVKTSWAARRVPAKRTGPPQRHEFVPTTFYQQFSAANPPVLHIWPGDTVHTTTVDAGGADAKGVTQVLGGNPQTGPFYVETALPGDVLAVHLNGARLYIGDGHAAQGDGELNGNALETSMEVEFTVDVLADKRLMTPRVESPTHIMSVGLGGNLEDALRAATAGLSQWLEQDYQLTPSEIAMVLGSSVEYAIAEVADRNAGVAAKLRKDRLTFK